MGWTRMPRRAAARKHHRPGVESLEIRTLLSSDVVGPRRLENAAVMPAGNSYSGPANNFDPIVGASAARSSYKVDGTGYSVAVIDAGVDYQTPALGGGLGAGKKVVAGWDFAGNDADPMPSGLEHGTAVAGLIASSDPSYPGVAPGADVVALRIFDDSNQSSFSRVADALQWVVDHHDQYNITVVNLSISDGGNYAQNWYAHDSGVGERITGLINQLDTLNIPVVTAAGNSFDGKTQGLGFTGIVADSISVTASDANDRLMSNAQRLGKSVGGDSAVDLAAPGDALVAPGDNGVSSVSGTSFATPLVTGAVVLLQQAYQTRFNKLPSVADIEGWLQGGSDQITDSVTGISLGRLDIPKALALVPTPALQVLTPPTPVTPAPVPVVSTPAPTPAPAPAPTPTPTPPPTPSPKVTVNGQQVDVSNIDGAPAAVSGFLQKVLRSFRSWWGASSRLQIWSATPKSADGVAPAGVVKPIVRKTATAGLTKQTPLRTKPAADVATAAKPATTGMTRAWHAREFVGARRHR
ncbi:MAG: S8 family serine peptidase [Isosphaeraceae bacterium]